MIRRRRTQSCDLLCFAAASAYAPLRFASLRYSNGCTLKAGYLQSGLYLNKDAAFSFLEGGFQWNRL
jgi:hypothetical protein